MNTYTWGIKQLDCNPQVDEISNFVVTAHWTLVGTDGTRYGSAYGATSFKKDPTKTNYMPYEQLTPEVIVDWVKINLGAEKLANLEASIDKQISDQILPEIITPSLPWI